MSELTYDKDNKKIPSKEFLFMIKIMLRKAGAETETSLVSWLEQITTSDMYDDKALLTAVQALLDEHYPEKLQPLNPEDFKDDDEEYE